MPMPLRALIILLSLTAISAWGAQGALDAEIQKQIQCVQQDGKAMRKEMTEIRERLAANALQLAQLEVSTTDNRREFHDHERAQTDRALEYNKLRNPLSRNFKGAMNSIGGSGKSIRIALRNLFSNGKNNDQIAAINRQNQELQSRLQALEASVRAGEASEDALNQLHLMDETEQSEKILQILNGAPKDYPSKVHQYHVQQIMKRAPAAPKPPKLNAVTPPASEEASEVVDPYALD